MQPLAWANPLSDLSGALSQAPRPDACATAMAQSSPMDKSDFELPVDDEGKCLEFRPFKLALGFIPVPHCGRRRTTNPHMRAFWAATLAFMSAFVGWFAFAPLLFYVRKDIGICDNNDAVQLDIENEKCSCKKGGDCKATISKAN